MGANPLEGVSYRQHRDFLNRAVDELRSRGEIIPDEFLALLRPLARSK